MSESTPCARERERERVARARLHIPVAVAEDDDYGYGAPKKQKVQIEKPSNPGAQRLTLTLALADHQPGSQHPDPRPSPSRPAQPCSTSTTFALADQTRHAAALLCLLPSARGRLVPSDQAQVQGHGPRHEVQGSLRPLRRLRQEERAPRLSETAPALSGRSQRHRRTRRPCGWGGVGKKLQAGAAAGG